MRPIDIRSEGRPMQRDQLSTLRVQSLPRCAVVHLLGREAQNTTLRSRVCGVLRLRNIIGARRWTACELQIVVGGIQSSDWRLRNLVRTHAQEAAARGSHRRRPEIPAGHVTLGG